MNESFNSFCSAIHKMLVVKKLPHSTQVISCPCAKNGANEYLKELKKQQASTEVC